MFGKGGDDKWRQKYDALRKSLREQEREWTELESLLQRAVNRVAIAAAGADPRMDPALDRIRSGVKGNIDRKRLDSGLKALADAVKQVEASPRAPAGHSPTLSTSNTSAGDLLIAILERLSFDESVRTRFLETIDYLSRFPDAQDEIQARVVALLNDSLSAARSSPRAGPAVAAAAPTAAPDTPILDADRLSAALQSLLGRLSLQGAAGQAVLERVRDPVAESIEEVLRTLADQLRPRLATSTAGAPSAGADDGGDLRALLSALAGRIGRIDGLEAAASVLLSRLKQPVSAADWPAILQSLTDALAGAIDAIRAQKAELEAFISQVGQQLGQFERFVKTSQDDLDSARSGRQQLSTQLGDEMQNIRASMDVASSVEDMKRSVLGSLTLIAERIQAFREHEESRIAAAEQRNHDLIRQIDSLRFEAKRLREENDEQLEQLMLDPLTKVHSRYAYEKRLEEEFSRWQRYRQPLSFVIWDIDRFKSINDGFGHKAGDRLLQMVARLLSRNSRKSDFLARIGGEEFVMLLPGTRASEALIIANKLRRLVSETGFHYKNKPRPVTISAGITEFADDDVPDAVYQRADGGLYKAKQQGRDRCELV